MGRVGKIQIKKTGARPMRAVARFGLAEQPRPSGQDSISWNSETRTNSTNLKRETIS
jgi:hypothetical protein